MSPSIAERLNHPDAAERRAACRDAVDDPAGVIWIESLIESLGDPDKAVARSASDALATLGRRTPGTERQLRDVLRGDDPTRRWGAAFTLARLAPPDPGLLPAVVEAMGARDGDVRWAAAKLLVEMGRLHGEIFAVALALAGESSNPVVQRMATFSLRELAPDDPRAAEALLQASRSPDPALRRAAFTALAALLDPPASVTQHLIEVLSAGDDAICRRLAALALGELGARRAEGLAAPGRAALEAARDESSDPDLRRSAERALARLRLAEARA